MENRLSLNGEWQLYYALEDRDMVDDLQYLHTHGERIAAQVPGNVELDLFRAGKEPDPFYGENIYRYRKYEFYRWQFERSFTAPENNGSRWVLVFEGLNNFAEIYLNGELIGKTANSLIAHRLDVTEHLRWGEENHLTVLIRSAANVVRKMDIPAYVQTGENGHFMMMRMPASSFGWDIMARFPSAGMWRGVQLEEEKPTRIVDAYYATTHLSSDGSARLLLRCRWETDEPVLDGFSIEVDGVCGDSVFHAEKKIGFVDCAMQWTVPDAKLWWPKGYGEPSLYQVTLTLKHNGQAVAVRRDRIGIRRFELVNVLKPKDEGEFLIKANGCPILCKGSNWVPLDALHSRDAQRLQAAHDLFEDAGCNIIRCWGGNVYEDHAFFDLCDERGMMVWQDFAMACATYSPAPEFAAQIEEEAAAVVKKLRNHPSILLWAGDNEVDEGMLFRGYAMEQHRYNALTREVLPRVVLMHDPYRVYLPSSPYIPFGIAHYEVPEQHNWGPRAYFKDDFYKHSNAHFISECGYHGCPSTRSLAKYIPEADLEHWIGSDVWDTHNTDYIKWGRRSYNRIQLMQDQVEILFGKVPDKLADFARLSQITQAEAKKFFIERTRIKKWRRTGIIWWNMLDGWPQISDAVVDYYHAKKLAYYYIKRVQQPVAVLMDELEGWNRSVYLCNDSRTGCMVKYRIVDGDTGEVYKEGEKWSPANENVSLGSIRELSGVQKLYLITWEMDGKQYGNHYITGFPSFDAQQMLGWVDKIARLPEPFKWEV